MVKYDRTKKKLIIPNGLGNDVEGAYAKGYEDGYNDALRENNKEENVG